MNNEIKELILPELPAEDWDFGFAELGNLLRPVFKGYQYRAGSSSVLQ